MRRARLTIVLLLLVLGACTDKPRKEVATASSTTPPASANAGDSPQEYERRFIACMRAEGIDMSDPIPGDTTGRGALRYEIDVKGRGSDMVFQAALDKCMHLLPPVPPPPPPGPDDDAKALRFAQCMRENGVPDFPDPVKDPKDLPTPRKSVGGIIVGRGGSGYWIYEGSPQVQAALEKCRQFLPGSDASPSTGAGG
jgi:hypothetical protein